MHRKPGCCESSVQPKHWSATDTAVVTNLEHSTIQAAMKKISSIPASSIQRTTVLFSSPPYPERLFPKQPVLGLQPNKYNMKMALVHGRLPCCSGHCKDGHQEGLIELGLLRPLRAD